MFRSSAAPTAEATTGASQRVPAVIGFAAIRFVGSVPATSRGQSEEHRSFWESPQRGAYQAARHKRACEGGREVRIRVSDGLGMDRSGCPSSIICTAG